MADNLYIDLVSNASMQEFPENKPSMFNTKLARQIDLEGDWEIGLLELNHPKIEVNLRHVGEVWLSGDIPNSFKTKFTIDYTLQDPYAELKKKTNSVIEKASSIEGRKPELQQDGNKSFAIKNGQAKVDGKYRLASDFLIAQENGIYYGFTKEDLKNEQDNITKKKDKEFMAIPSRRNTHSPVISNKGKVVTNFIWLNGVTTPASITTNINPNDTLEQIVQTTNSDIDALWTKSSWKETKWPKPKLAMERDRLVIISGCIRMKKEVDIRLSYDEKTLDLLGFAETEISDGSSAITRAKYQPNSGMSNLLFFYTDVVEQHHVGDSMSNSLRGIPLKKGENVNHLTFNPVIYHPVSLKKFDTIAVKISDEIGRDPDFTTGGRLHATLHLKRKFI